MAAGATFWTLDFEGFGKAFAEANFGSVGAFGDKNMKNSWPYTQFWVGITNKMSKQAHICSFGNRLKMKRTWIKQWHAAPWRNPGAGMMSSARGFGGLAARCPLPNSPAWGQDTGHGGPWSLWWDTSLRHALPLPWPPERPASSDLSALSSPPHFPTSPFTDSSAGEGIVFQEVKGPHWCLLTSLVQGLNVSVFAW